MKLYGWHSCAFLGTWSLAELFGDLQSADTVLTDWEQIVTGKCHPHLHPHSLLPCAANVN